MQLIAPLAAGVRGAGNGYASFVLRGTSTAATVYADHAGKVRLYGDVQLDSSGSARAYVSDLVDVSVYTEAGAIVRSWTDGQSAGAITIDHDAVTATNLAAVLSSVKTSSGAADWNVLLDGTEQSVYAAIYGSAGVFYSAAQYGASGDNTGDDWGPIQGAINAAYAAGGGVVFLPAGTYRTSSSISLPDKVSLIGASPNASIITLFGDDSVLVLGGTARQNVQSLTLKRSVASSFPLLSNMAQNAVIDNVLFDGTSCNGVLLDMDSGGIARVADCYFYLEDGAGAVNTFTTLSGRVDMATCLMEGAATYSSADTGVVGIYNVHLDGCVFNFDNTTSGTVKAVVLSGDIYGTVDGCEHLIVAGPTHTFLDYGALNNSGGKEFVFEDCTLFDYVGTLTLHAVSESSLGYYARLRSVGFRHSPVTQVTTVINAGNIHYLTSDASQYGVWSFYNTDASAGAGSSGMCFGAATSSTYSANVEQGREAIVIYALKTAEDFLQSAPDENRTRNSVAPGWKSLAGSAHVNKMLMVRAYAQSPTVGDMTRWHCIGQSSGQPTVDTAYREGYTF